MQTAATLPRSTTAGALPGADARRLRIASVCKLLPTSSAPQQGLFVKRRLAQLARLADVQVIQPIPWFPLLRRRQAGGWAAGDDSLCVYRQPMFYVPGLMKGLDGRWLARSILPVLARWRDDAGIDLVDAHFGYPEGVGAVLAAERLGIPAYITIRGNELVYLENRSIRPQLLDAFARCKGIIAVSNGLRDAIGSAGVDLSKVAVIPNAVDRSEFFPSSRDEARRRLNLPPHSPVVVSIGQQVSGKGHHVLIEAVERLRRVHPDVVLVIVGGPAYQRQYPRRLDALIEKLDLRSTVKLVGSQQPAMVTRYLNAADVFALCTTREGCCNAVIEALACGLPVVTTAAGDNERYVDAPRHGYIVPPGDAAAVCDALAQTLSRSWDRDAISGSVCSQSWEAVAGTVLDFFNSRLGSPIQRSAPSA